MARTRVAMEEAAPVAPKRAERPDRKERKERKRSEVKVAPVVMTSERKYHQTIRRIDVWTVLKVSVCFYLSALVVTLGAGTLVWYAARTLGLIDDLERLVRSLFGFKEFSLLSWRILRASSLIGVVVACSGIVMTTLAAAFYNLFAGIVGGVEITVVEDDQAR